MKRKRTEDQAHHERWLVSYADFVTLLFALFVVLYASSQADLEKLKKVTESLKKSFQFNEARDEAKEVEIDPRISDEITPPPTSLSSSSAPSQESNLVSNSGPNLPSEVAPPLAPALQGFEGRLQQSQWANQFNLSRREDGVLVRLQTEGFFKVEQVEMDFEYRPLIDQIALVLSKDPGLKIRLEGHSDLQETQPQKYPSGWELSAARAGWLAQYWMRKYQIDPRRIEIVGYAHFRPLDQSHHASKKGLNRRVEILVLGSIP